MTEQPTLFEVKRTSRRLTHKERGAAYRLLRYMLRGDVPKPDGEILNYAFSAMMKLKNFRRKKND